MRRVRRSVLVILLAGIPAIGAIALAAVSLSRGTGETQPQASRSEVATATAARGTIRSVVVLDGVAVPAPATPIVAPASGVLAAGRAQTGERVRAGEEMARVRLSGGNSVAIVAPAAGLIRLWTASDGDQVQLNDQIGSVDPARFLAVAVVPPEILFRFYGSPVSISVKLDKGPAPFACPFDSLGASLTGGESDPASVPVHLACSIPEDVRVFSGVRLRLAAVTGISAHALLLPLEAVAGEADRGFVTLIDEQGRTAQRDVVLGLTDGVNIEILQGLTDGDRVVVPPADGSSLLPSGGPT